MTERVIQFLQRHGGAVVSRRLSAMETVAFGAGLMALAMVYCQIYCLLALQQMHGSSMSLQASFWRVAVDVLPAYAALEISKRVPVGRRSWEWPLIVSIFCVALVAALLLRLQNHVMTPEGFTARHMAVDRLPYLLIAVAGVAWFRRETQRRERDLERAGGVFEADKLPPLRSIDWVRAAGNYVEVHFASRSRLFRMTLRGARVILPEDEFLQIHRSVIVRRSAIERIAAFNRVTMSDGSELPIGDTFRSKLDASQG